MSEKLNLIFIQNGYGKYCLDMEVNDISALKYGYKKYKQVPREELVARLTKEDKELILKAFIRDREGLQKQIEESNRIGDKILILTDPLCSLEIRKKIFADLIERYRKEGTVFLKPHPGDELVRLGADFMDKYEDPLIHRQNEQI